VLGWNKFIPLVPKMSVPIHSFTYTSADVLVIVSENGLHIIDTVGQLMEIYKLPNSNMKITAGDSVLYVYDNDDTKQEKGYAVYLLHDDISLVKLIELSTPVTSILESNGNVFIAVKNNIYSMDVGNKKMKHLVQLPEKDEKIISIATDYDNDILYFSTDNAIYGLKDTIAWRAIDQISGMLKYYYNELYVFNPEKNFLSAFHISTPLENESEKDETYLSAYNITNNQEKTSQIIDSVPITLPSHVSTVMPDIVHENQQPKRDEILETSTSVIKQPNQQETGVAVTSANQIEAIDYVSEAKALVDFFKIKRDDFTSVILQWDEQIRAIMKEIDNTAAAIVQTEKEMEEANNSTLLIDQNTITAFKNTLNGQRSLLKQLKKRQVDKGVEITKQLDDISKQYISAIDKTFGETIKKITPTSTFPSLSEKRVMVTFSDKIEALSVLRYLRTTDGLRFWYQNIETSFFEIIEERNQSIKGFMETDLKLSTQLKTLNDKLADYQKEPKVRKKEIKDVKKEISALEKERKNVVNQMKKSAKDFASYLKSYNKTIQTEYKVRIQNIIEEINYLFQENS
jgi:hypothetical protein